MSKFSLVLTAVLLPSVLPSVSQAATEVVVWHSYRAKERRAIEKVASNFNAQSKDVKIKLLTIPFDAFGDKITAAIPRGKGPDLFIFAQDRLGDWAASDLLEAVDFWMDDEMTNSFLPMTMQAVTYDDSVFGLPMSYKMLALFYNKKLVNKAPVSTDELLAAAKKHTNPGKGKFGLVYENANFYQQAMWLHGFGGKVFNRKGRPTLATPQVIDSMKFAQKLAHQSGVMPEEVTSTLVTSLFNSGKAAFVINGPWFLGEVDKGVKYGIAPLPVISESKKPAAPFLTVDSLIMSAKAKDKKAAFKVMQHLTSKESAIIMATQGGQPPARKDVYTVAAVKNDPLLSVFRKQLDNSVPMPNTPAMRMVWSPATTAMNKIINGKSDAAAAMKKAQTEIASLVKKAKR